MPGVRYTYRVRAVDAAGSSAPTNTDEGVLGLRDAYARNIGRSFDFASKSVSG